MAEKKDKKSKRSQNTPKTPGTRNLAAEESRMCVGKMHTQCNLKNYPPY